MRCIRGRSRREERRSSTTQGVMGYKNTKEFLHYTLRRGQIVEMNKYSFLIEWSKHTMVETHRKIKRIPPL